MAVFGLAILACTIVFSEPAVADMLMALAIAAVIVLGAGRFGRFAAINMCLWVGLIGLGMLALQRGTAVETGVTHQFVTLFLVAGAVAIAAFIARDPEPRFRLVMWCYLWAALIATAAGLAGYFNLLPGAYDLFTNYGRARGTFKDPNVYGAAVTPALVFAVWLLLREPPARAKVAAIVALPLLFGLLLSFSRGAWISFAVSIGLMLWLSVVRTRRRSDRRRFALVAGFGAMAVLAGLLIASRVEQVGQLLQARASLDQSYDEGPEGRFGGQAKARRLIVENPFGIGTHTFRTTHHIEEPHNVYLSMFLNAGWLGGGAYIASLLLTLVAGMRGALRTSALQGPFIISTCVIAGLIVEGFVIDSDHWRHFFIFLGLIWGLVDARLPSHDSAQRRSDPVAA